MKPYQERVMQEKIELDAKRARLDAFIENDEFGSLGRIDQQLLVVQADAMTTYSCVLAQRILNFNSKPCRVAKRDIQQKEKRINDLRSTGE